MLNSSPLLNTLFASGEFLLEKQENNDRVLVHKDVGAIVFRKQPRNRSIRILLRPQREVLVTLPSRCSYAEADKLVCEKLDWIKIKQTEINARQAQKRVYSEEEIARLRLQAKTFLPPRIAQLAAQHNFTYTHISFKNMHTRWGSCSFANRLNFSIYLMNLSNELVDYVILHELCHTIHKNHGVRFWALLDKVSNGQAKELSLKMRKLHS